MPGFSSNSQPVNGDTLGSNASGSVRMPLTPFSSRYPILGASHEHVYMLHLYPLWTRFIFGHQTKEPPTHNLLSHTFRGGFKLMVTQPISQLLKLLS